MIYVHIDDESAERLLLELADTHNSLGAPNHPSLANRNDINQVVRI